MQKLFICLAFAVLSVYGTGEFTVLHSTESAQFLGHDAVPQSLLKDIFSACLGFTITKGSDWPGLSVPHPFNYAEAAVVVVVDGPSSLDLKKGQSYPMITDEDESECWQTMRDRVLQRYPEENSTLYRMDLVEEKNPHLSGDYDVSNNWSVKYLDKSMTEDKQFLDELSMISNLAKRVESNFVYRDGVPDVYWIVVRGLHAVLDIHGPKSKAAEEATQLLVQLIDRLTKAFIQAYKNQVLVATVCSDVSHTRRTRSLKAMNDNDDYLNLSPEYSADYPVIFNIMLWFGIAFVFTLLAVSLFIADMDPGRDSIIYRMTSTRMKKDN